MRKRRLLKYIFLVFIAGFCFTVIIPLNLFVCKMKFKDNISMTQKMEINAMRKVTEVDCRKIIEGDKRELLFAKKFMDENQRSNRTDEYFINKTKDCAKFKLKMKYNIFPITDEERNFPIAFSILTFKDVEQTERLLRAIYREQNLYCIHVDRSSTRVFHQAMLGISQCFENVFIVSKTEDVIYNHVSRLRADLNCMDDLLKRSANWTYFINLPHQQFPLKTNLEMVKILKIYNGANDIEGIISPHRMLTHRYRYHHKYSIETGKWTQTKFHNFHLPYKAHIVKGSAYGIFSRKFVQFIVQDKVASDILDYIKDVKSPDEYYWATLNHNNVLNIPGQFKGNPETKPWLAAYASWRGTNRCHGKFIRDVCVFGIGDLNELVSKNQFFANKFYLDYQYLTLDCLEEYIYNKSFSKLPFDTFYYKQLPFIIH